MRRAPSSSPTRHSGQTQTYQTTHQTSHSTQMQTLKKVGSASTGSHSSPASPSKMYVFIHQTDQPHGQIDAYAADQIATRRTPLIPGPSPISAPAGPTSLLLSATPERLRQRQLELEQAEAQSKPSYQPPASSNRGRSLTRGSGTGKQLRPPGGAPTDPHAYRVASVDSFSRAYAQLVDATAGITAAANSNGHEQQETDRSEPTSVAGSENVDVDTTAGTIASSASSVSGRTRSVSLERQKRSKALAALKNKVVQQQHQQAFGSAHKLPPTEFIPSATCVNGPKTKAKPATVTISGRAIPYAAMVERVTQGTIPKPWEGGLPNRTRPNSRAPSKSPTPTKRPPRSQSSPAAALQAYHHMKNQDASEEEAKYHHQSHYDDEHNRTNFSVHHTQETPAGAAPSTNTKGGAPRSPPFSPHLKSSPNYYSDSGDHNTVESNEYALTENETLRSTISFTDKTTHQVAPNTVLSSFQSTSHSYAPPNSPPPHDDDDELNYRLTPIHSGATGPITTTTTVTTTNIETSEAVFNSPPPQPLHDTAASHPQSHHPTTAQYQHIQSTSSHPPPPPLSPSLRSPQPANQAPPRPFGGRPPLSPSNRSGSFAGIQPLSVGQPTSPNAGGQRKTFFNEQQRQQYHQQEQAKRTNADAFSPERPFLNHPASTLHPNPHELIVNSNPHLYPPNAYPPQQPPPPPMVDGTLQSDVAAALAQRTSQVESLALLNEKLREKLEEFRQQNLQNVSIADAEISKLSLECEHLRRENSELEKRVSILSEEKTLLLKGHGPSVSEAHLAIEELQNEKQQLVKQVHQAEKLKKQQEEQASLEIILLKDELEKQRQSYEKQLKEFQEQSRNEVQQYQNELDTHKAHGLAVVNELKTLREVIKGKEDEIVALHKTLRTVSDELDSGSLTLLTPEAKAAAAAAVPLSPKSSSRPLSPSKSLNTAATSASNPFLDSLTRSKLLLQKQQELRNAELAKTHEVEKVERLQHALQVESTSASSHSNLTSIVHALQESRSLLRLYQKEHSNLERAQEQHGFETYLLENEIVAERFVKLEKKHIHGVFTYCLTRWKRWINAEKVGRQRQAQTERAILAKVLKVWIHERALALKAKTFEYEFARRLFFKTWYKQTLIEHQLKEEQKRKEAERIALEEKKAVIQVWLHQWSDCTKSHQAHRRFRKTQKQLRLKHWWSSWKVAMDRSQKEQEGIALVHEVVKRGLISRMYENWCQYYQFSRQLKSLSKQVETSFTRRMWSRWLQARFDLRVQKRLASQASDFNSLAHRRHALATWRRNVSASVREVKRMKCARERLRQMILGKLGRMLRGWKLVANEHRQIQLRLIELKSITQHRFIRVSFHSWYMLMQRVRLKKLSDTNTLLQHDLGLLSSRLKVLSTENSVIQTTLQERVFSEVELKEQEAMYEKKELSYQINLKNELALKEKLKAYEQREYELSQSIHDTRHLLSTKISESRALANQLSKEQDLRKQFLRDYEASAVSHSALLENLDLILAQTASVMQASQFQSVENSKQWVVSVTNRLRNMLQQHHNLAKQEQENKEVAIKAAESISQIAQLDSPLKHQLQQVSDARSLASSPTRKMFQPLHGDSYIPNPSPSSGLSPPVPSSSVAFSPSPLNMPPTSVADASFLNSVNGQTSKNPPHDQTSSSSVPTFETQFTAPTPNQTRSSYAPSQSINSTTGVFGASSTLPRPVPISTPASRATSNASSARATPVPPAGINQFQSSLPNTSQFSSSLTQPASASSSQTPKLSSTPNFSSFAPPPPSSSTSHLNRVTNLSSMFSRPNPPFGSGSYETELDREWREAEAMKMRLMAQKSSVATNQSIHGVGHSGAFAVAVPSPSAYVTTTTSSTTYQHQQLQTTQL